MLNNHGPKEVIYEPYRYGRSTTIKFNRTTQAIGTYVCLKTPVGLLSLNRAGFNIYTFYKND